MKQLVIVGASGHGKVVADIALRIGKYSKVCFLDDNISLNECMGCPVIGTCDDIHKFVDRCDMFIAIGNAKTRKKLLNKLIEEKASIPILVHPSAVVGTNVKIGVGTVVMAGSVINPETSIGVGCIINTCASVDHDCNISDYVHISVGAHVAGSVSVGECTWVGAGAVINNNISITRECMVGAGAVVVKNIEKIGTYVGVPAKEMV